MSDIVNCPSCQRPLQVPEDLWGTLVKCPACGTTFMAMASARPAAQPPAAAQPAPGMPPAEERPPYAPEPGPYVADHVRGVVAAPAVCLLVIGGVGLLCSLHSVVQVANGQFRAAFQQMAANAADAQVREMFLKAAEFADGPASVAFQLAFVVVNVFIILGAIAMLRRRVYGLAVAAGILAMLDVNQCCCIAGLPIGIWSLVVLSRPDVRSAFQ